MYKGPSSRKGEKKELFSLNLTKHGFGEESVIYYNRCSLARMMGMGSWGLIYFWIWLFLSFFSPWIEWALQVSLLFGRRYNCTYIYNPDECRLFALNQNTALTIQPFCVLFFFGYLSRKMPTTRLPLFPPAVKLFQSAGRNFQLWEPIQFSSG